MIGSRKKQILSVFLVIYEYSLLHNLEYSTLACIITYNIENLHSVEIILCC